MQPDFHDVAPAMLRQFALVGGVLVALVVPSVVVSVWLEAAARARRGEPSGRRLVRHAVAVLQRQEVAGQVLLSVQTLACLVVVSVGLLLINIAALWEALGLFAAEGPRRQANAELQQVLERAGWHGMFWPGVWEDLPGHWIAEAAVWTGVVCLLLYALGCARRWWDRWARTAFVVVMGLPLMPLLLAGLLTFSLWAIGELTGFSRVDSSYAVPLVICLLTAVVTVSMLAAVEALVRSWRAILADRAFVSLTAPRADAG